MCLRGERVQTLECTLPCLLHGREWQDHIGCPRGLCGALNSLKAGLNYDVLTEDGTKTLAKIKTNENISCVLYGGEKRYTNVDDGGESFTAHQFTPYGPGVCEGADDPTAP